MAGVCLGGSSREPITQWFYRMQRDVRNPSDCQHGVAATDSFVSADLDTRGGLGDVDCLKVYAGSAAPTHPFGSGDGVREDGEIGISG